MCYTVNEKSRIKCDAKTQVKIHPEGGPKVLIPNIPGNLKMEYL